MSRSLSIFTLFLWSVVMTSCSGAGDKREAKVPSSSGEPGKPYWGSADVMNAACAYHLDSAKMLQDRLIAASGPRTEENTVGTYNELLFHVDQVLGLSDLITNVHPERPVRDAAEACQKNVQKFLAEFSLNRNVFEAFRMLDLSRLAPDSRRQVERLLRDFRRAGVDRDEKTRAELAKLHEEMVAAGQEFLKNIREDKRKLELAGPSDLAGLPEDFIASHPPDEKGRITVTTDYPDFFPIETYADREELRRDLLLKFLSRGYPVNTAALKRILDLRYRYAVLLGYPDWASYNAEDKMVREAGVIEEFIDKVAAIARPRMEKDLQVLLDRKRKDRPDADAIHQWDRFYYLEKVRKEKFGVDSQEVRAYFPYERVKQGIFDVSSRLFGVTFRKAEAETWHPSVEYYEVLDGGEKVGAFYMDMHPRQDKYGHAATFPILTGVDGRQIPTGALVCNFPDPAKGQALLEHNDVTTFFHEFGHLLHHLLSGRQRLISLSGVMNIEWDFIEVPSQLLEEWTWDPDVLATFAIHFEKNTPIPAELVRRMKAAEEFGKGVNVMRQLGLASLSLGYYHRNPEAIDLDAYAREVNAKYSPFPYEDGTCLFCNFEHLESYSSAYYTYMWSLYLAKDCLTRFKTDGFMNPQVASRYKTCILSAGSSRDASEMLQCFLERAPSFEAFRLWLEENDI